MISVEEALNQIRANAPRLGSERIPTAQAQGFVLSSDLLADRDSPPFNRVMMDGYAIFFERWNSGTTRFQVQATVPAGAAPPNLFSDNYAIEVMTGGVLPLGCDTVIPVEETERDNDQVVIKADPKAFAPGTFVHAKGTDHKKGAVVLQAGSRIRAPELAVAATEGAAELEVSFPPAVCLITTGDEVVSPDKVPEAHQIRQSHPAAIEALMLAWGPVVWSTLHSPDRHDALLAAIKAGLKSSDILLLTGGVSAGKWDLVPDLLAKAGVTCAFHKIAQKPGKPMWFGTTGKKMVFGLPGNPISAMCCVRRYVWAALNASSGRNAAIIPTMPTLAPIKRIPGLTTFVPVKCEELGARPRPPQNSGHLHMLVETDGFLEVLPGEGQIPMGTPLPYFSWS